MNSVQKLSVKTDFSEVSSFAPLYETPKKFRSTILNAFLTVHMAKAPAKVPQMAICEPLIEV